MIQYTRGLAHRFRKKEKHWFRQAPVSSAKVCVLIWGMFHEFTYSMIIHDFFVQEVRTPHPCCVPEEAGRWSSRKCCCFPA